MWVKIIQMLGSYLSSQNSWVSNFTRLNFVKVHYNFCFINFEWKWLTTTLEVHGAQVLPDSDYKSKNVFLPHQNSSIL